MKKKIFGQNKKAKYLNEQNINNKIAFIDGDQLAQLMINHNVGVTPVQNYEIKKIDSDYFT